MIVDLLHPLTLPVTAPITSAITAALGGSASAFSAVKKVIQDGSADANILVIGDSTGDANDEWVYLFGQWLASEYPTHSVSYRLWNDTTKAYNSAISLGTGSGSRTIRIWNGSVSGTVPYHLTGEKLAASVTATNAELVIWNHGLNLISRNALSTVLTRGAYMDGMEMVRSVLPNAAHAAMRQNPRRDDNTMESVVAQLDSVMASYTDMVATDAYSKFIAAGKPAGWYADNIHPNGTGEQAFLAAVQEKWRASLPAAYTPSERFLLTTATNLLPNSEFSDTAYTGGVPTGWTAINSPTCTVETTIVDAGAPQSLKIVGTSASAAIYRDITGSALDAIKGKKVTLAVRQFVPSGALSNIGAVTIIQNGTPALNISTQANNANGGWRWRIFPSIEVNANATFFRVLLYCDLAANVSSAAYYDRAILVEGELPRDLA